MGVDVTAEAGQDTNAQKDSTAAVYALARSWSRGVLPTGDSILTPGTPIWTAQNLAELEEKFIDRPDNTPGKSFLQ